MARKNVGRNTAPRRQPETERTIDTDGAPDIGTVRAALIFLGISLLYFLPAFMPGRHVFGSDYTQIGFIIHEFARQQFASGELPKWLPHIYGGLPMFANPGSLFYPVFMLSNLVLPGTWVLPTLYVFQFAAAGVGMYLLTREIGCRSWVSFVSGLAFQLTGITLSAVQAGHDGRIIVATLAPLFLFFLYRAVRTGSIAAFAGAAATLGFTLLSFQIQSNYYLILAGAAWAMFALVHLDIVRAPRTLALRTTLGLGAVAFGFMLAAVNFLPFREYVADSPRGVARGYEYSTSWSLPPVEVLGVAVPEHTGELTDYRGVNAFKLNTEYAGALVLVLLVLGFALSRRSRHWWFFLGLAAFMLIISLGGHTPIYRIFYELLPGTQRFRAPSIAFFIVSLCLVGMAALTLERVARLRDDRQRGDGRMRSRDDTGTSLGRLLGGTVAGVMIMTVLGTAASGGDSSVSVGFVRFAFFAVLVCLLLWLWWISALRTTAFVILLAFITVTDLVAVNRKYFSTVDGPDVMFAVDPLISFLMNVPQPSRIWILPAADWEDNNVLMLFDVEQAGGQHGNQLHRFNEYAGTTGESYVDWHNMLAHSNFVNAANIRYIVSRVDLPLAEDDTLVMRQVHRVGGFVYENRRALPRAYLVGRAVATADTMAALEILRDDSFDVSDAAVVYTSGDLDLPDTPLQGDVTVVEHTPNRVVLSADASRPALLVLADNFHRDWVARVNGNETPILRANHTFRGVPVGAGRSEVVFEFHPRALYTGFYMYLAGFALLLAYAAWLIVMRVRQSRGTATQPHAGARGGA